MRIDKECVLMFYGDYGLQLPFPERIWRWNLVKAIDNDPTCFKRQTTGSVFSAQRRFHAVILLAQENHTKFLFVR